MPSVQALDRYETYYAEKIWEMIPELYRHEDGLAQQPGVLRALVEILAQQAAGLRRSQDRLWEDQFIEWCNEWAVPYLGELVGTRMVSALNPALNPRGCRMDVAKTIYYRRHKGTPRVLEELISDIAGWDGKVVEEFRRLARARHGLDPKPRPYAGPHSGTLPGGWADIRNPLAGQFTDTAFDEFFHTPDLRRPRGEDGRLNIPKLAFHLYRLTALPLIGVTPFQRTDPATFTFDPSGRDLQLFNVRQRAAAQGGQPRNWDQWQPAQVWELPLPMRRRVLGHAEYRMTDELLARVDDMVNPQPPAQPVLPGLLDALRPLRGERFGSEERLLQTLRQLPGGKELMGLANWPEIWTTVLAAALVTDCGKFQLLPGALEVVEIPDPGASSARPLAPLQLAAANLSDWSLDCPEKPEKLCLVDPELGRLKLIGKSGNAPHRPWKVMVSYHCAFPGPLGAGTYERQGSLASPVTSSVSGGGVLDQGKLVQVAQIEDSLSYGPVHDPADFTSLVLQAADRQRPYLRLEGDWVFTAQGLAAELTLEGLWIGGRSRCDLVLRGDFAQVTIRHCTLDPGGITADGEEIPPVRLVIEGQVKLLLLDSSVTGPLCTRKPAAFGAPLVETLQVQDCILQSLRETELALDLQSGEARLERTTILGASRLHRLWASELLAAGTVAVVDAQNGCFRFSAALAGSLLPHPYQSGILQETGAVFTSRRFGHWGYAQIAGSAPDFVREGGENGSELGAFSACCTGIRLKGLQAKVEEYLPFGLIPVFIPEV